MFRQKIWRTLTKCSQRQAKKKKLGNIRMKFLHSIWWSRIRRHLQKMRDANLESRCESATPCRAVPVQSISRQDKRNLQSAERPAASECKVIQQKGIDTPWPGKDVAIETRKMHTKESSGRKRQDHVTETGPFSKTHNNLLHRHILDPKAVKILDAKASMDEERDQLQKLPEWIWGDTTKRAKVYQDRTCKCAGAQQWWRASKFKVPLTIITLEPTFKRREDLGKQCLYSFP